MSLAGLDYWLFEGINDHLSNPVFDALLPIARDKRTWFPFYGIASLFLIYRYRWKGLWMVLLAVITVFCTDQLSASLIKPAVGRMRPCNLAPGTWEDLNLLVRCGSGFSFPSTHATNHFGLATIFGLLFSKHRSLVFLLFIWAALVSFAQIYVGLHFPSDVLAGALLGVLVASVLFALGKRAAGHRLIP